MTERRIPPETPEAILDNLVSVAQATDWMGVVRVFAEDNFDVVSEAKWYAQRGVLSGAVSFASVVPTMTHPERIGLIRDLATQALAFLFAKETLSEKERVTEERAKAVVKLSSDFLQRSQRKAS